MPARFATSSTNTSAMSRVSPGRALPNGFTATGLPISLQIACRGYDEATALRIGWAYQQATDWHERRPPGMRHRKPHPTGGRSVVIIFDLRFGERGLLDDRPENRLGALV